MIDSEQLKQHMVKAVEEIRATNPMAGSITNTVTIDFVANAQLAVGGSAAMVYLPDEGEALVAGGGAIYLNMGTLFPIYEQTIPRAAKAAHDAGMNAHLSKPLDFNKLKNMLARIKKNGSVSL